MRRRGRAVAVGVVAMGALVAGCGEPATGPELPEVDFTPTAVVVVDEDGLTCDGDAAGCTVEAGSVIEVRNEGDGEHRVAGEGAFDTGIMLPGDTTVVVLPAEPGEVEVTERGDPDAALVLVLEPPAAAG